MLLPQQGGSMNKLSVALLPLLLAAAAPLSMSPGGTQQRGNQAAPSRIAAAAPIRRTPDGKPDLTGYYQTNAGGANYGLERHSQDFLTPATRGVVVDPPD